MKKTISGPISSNNLRPCPWGGCVGDCLLSALDTVSDVLIKAVKNNINLYAIHTNLDNVYNGVNNKIASIIGLERLKILMPKQNLLKLAVFVPESHSEQVLEAMFNSGAGHIGNYESCSFISYGEGTFLPNQGANPYKGEIGRLEKSKEIKLEVILSDYSLTDVIFAMNNAHPYEEVAYDIFKIQNNSNCGSGMIGELSKEMDEIKFLKLLKNSFNAKGISGVVKKILNSK